MKQTKSKTISKKKETGFNEQDRMILLGKLDDVYLQLVNIESKVDNLIDMNVRTVYGSTAVDWSEAYGMRKEEKPESIEPINYDWFVRAFRGRVQDDDINMVIPIMDKLNEVISFINKKWNR